MTRFELPLVVVDRVIATALEEDLASGDITTEACIDADDLARMIADGVASGRHRIIYPAVYGMSRHFPNLTRFLLDRFTPPLKALPSGGEKG